MPFRHLHLEPPFSNCITFSRRFDLNQEEQMSRAGFIKKDNEVDKGRFIAEELRTKKSALPWLVLSNE